MKNTIYIEIDTENVTPIMFGKGPNSKTPTNHEEAAEMILVDINCMTEALLSLIHLADQNNYGDKINITNEIIESLKKSIETTK